MSKRTQKESSEERVTAKSRPMMSLIARAPSTTSSSASESPGKRSYESQSPWSANAEKYDRTGQLVVGSDPRTALGHHHTQFVESSYSARYSGWDDDKAWSSQEWKTDDFMDDRTGTLVETAQHTDKIIVDNDKVNSYTEAESEMSLESRPFTSSNHVSLLNTSTSSLKKEKFTIERGHPLFALNEEQGHSNSSLETTKQNQNCQ